jgi:pyrroloquinoline quinone (PQQ) biosynthesis protein C
MEITMEAFDKVLRAFAIVEQRFMNSPALKRVASGSMTIDHYGAYLRETYFYTREDPQIQAAATAFFRGPDREMVELFLQHAKSEVGHDQLALNDLATIGFDTRFIPDEGPLPATENLIAYPYWAMAHKQAAAYLGYLYFLEFLPTSQGSGIAEALSRVGIPSHAMTFLSEHQQVDVHHNKLMRVYVNHMARDQSSLDAIITAMQATALNFELMLSCAFQSVDDNTSSLRRSETVAAES